MDGLTLLAKVNELKNPAMKCIMVSAYGDMDNIRSAMNKGRLILQPNRSIWMICRGLLKGDRTGSLYP